MQKCLCLLWLFFFSFSLSNLQAQPYKVSIITSVFNGDDFIEAFLEDTIRQSIFPQAELILVNANSPGNEEPIIMKYAAKYPNIKYLRLKTDPGLFAVYNLAIKQASADLIAIATLDNRRNPTALEREVRMLENHPEIDLIYQDYILSLVPNEVWENHHGYSISVPEYLPERMNLCLPGPQPVWRKNMHARYGWFDENYKYSGDWELWCRAASMGAKYKKDPGYSGIYYQNPTGLKLSKIDEQKVQERQKENQRIITRYQSHWKIAPEAQKIQNRQLGSSGYGTHIFPLMTVLAHTEGPILEVGTGDYSTPLLHALCSKNERFILSVDTYQVWLNFFLDLSKPWHQFKYIAPDDYASLEFQGPGKRWSVVFVDGAPAERRIEDIKRLRDKTDIFVLHDVEDPLYGYQPLISSFTYHYLYDRYLPHTMVVSDKIDVSQFFK
jgi:glycosyltransferase involved in cell wall biosynthesis